MSVPTTKIANFVTVETALHMAETATKQRLAGLQQEIAEMQVLEGVRVAVTPEQLLQLEQADFFYDFRTGLVRVA